LIVIVLIRDLQFLADGFFGGGWLHGKWRGGNGAGHQGSHHDFKIREEGNGRRKGKKCQITNAG
jgi:hypothetical protein